MTFRPPWKSPPPDLYKLKPVLGYRNHDITKKRAPAWSFVRYIPIPKPKPEVSPSPFQLMMKKKFGKRKRAQDMKQGRSDLITDGGISKKKMQHRRKKHKNKKRTNLEDSKLALAKNKQPQDGSSSKDKSKKVSSKLSVESGRFFVPPADMCDLCFPWMKKPGKYSDKQDDPKTKKIRRSRSISLVEEENNSSPRQHSFIVISRPHGKTEAEDQICEPHSGMMLPSGHKIQFTSTKHALPRPPLNDDGSESTIPRRPSPKKKKISRNADHVIMANG